MKKEHLAATYVSDSSVCVLPQYTLVRSFFSLSSLSFFLSLLFTQPQSAPPLMSNKGLFSFHANNYHRFHLAAFPSPGSLSPYVCPRSYHWFKHASLSLSTFFFLPISSSSSSSLSTSPPTPNTRHRRIPHPPTSPRFPGRQGPPGHMRAWGWQLPGFRHLRSVRGVRSVGHGQ